MLVPEASWVEDTWALRCRGPACRCASRKLILPPVLPRAAGSLRNAACVLKTGLCSMALTASSVQLLIAMAV